MCILDMRNEFGVSDRVAEMDGMCGDAEELIDSLIETNVEVSS